jgi:hypothetical protein
MKPEAIIKVRFKTTAEGGRQGPITLTEKWSFNCPMFIDGEYWDCRLLGQGPDQILQLGETYQLPVMFLHPDLVLPKLSSGKPVKLWEGKDIATGEVVRLV